jgi:hypothetical protein
LFCNRTHFIVPGLRIAPPPLCFGWVSVRVTVGFNVGFTTVFRFLFGRPLAFLSSSCSSPIWESHPGEREKREKERKQTGIDAFHWTRCGRTFSITHRLDEENAWEKKRGKFNREI